MKQRLSLSLGGNFLRTARALPFLVFFALPLFILAGGVRVLNKHEASAMPGPVPQQTQNRHPRAFVLEGIIERGDTSFTSKAPVEVFRNGRKLELSPGDEVQEGDRIRAMRRPGATFCGASVVIYNTEGEPVLIVGHHRGVDFTLSKLGFRKSNVHGAQVEIINHLPDPPLVERIDPSVANDIAEYAIFKEDGTRERPATQKEVDDFAFNMDLNEDHPGRRTARLMRAERMIKEGRKAAEQEYNQVQVEDESTNSATLKAQVKDGATNSATSTGSRACKLEGSWTQDTPGVGSTVWHIASDGTATEAGIGYAQGTARLSGNVLHIDWKTGNGYSGYYEWTLDKNCTSGKGTLQFQAPRTDSLNSTVMKNY